MPRLSRRNFLKLSGGAAAASFARVPWARAADLSAASGGLTTLDQTIVKGSKLADGTLGSYYRLTFGAGEPHLPRTDLHPASYAPIHCAMSFVHFTDSHLVDAQSPGRVEFLDRYSELQCGTLPFDAAFRPSTRRSGATRTIRDC